MTRCPKRSGCLSVIILNNYVFIAGSNTDQDVFKYPLRKKDTRGLTFDLLTPKSTCAFFIFIDVLFSLALTYFICYKLALPNLNSAEHCHPPPPHSCSKTLFTQTTFHTIIYINISLTGLFYERRGRVGTCFFLNYRPFSTNTHISYPRPQRKKNRI